MKLFYLALLLPFLLHAEKSRLALEAEFVYLKRLNDGNNQCLAQVSPYPPSGIEEDPLETSTCPQGQCKFTTKDLMFQEQFTPGLRASISYLPSKQSTWEGRYMGFIDWSGSRSATCPYNLIYPFTDETITDDYIDADKARGRLHTKLSTGEMNYWRHVTPRHTAEFSVSWAFGLRYVNLREKLSLAYTKGEDESHYRINTWNYMGGIQFGTALENNLARGFTWGLRAKMGGLVNLAEEKSNWKDENDTVLLYKSHATDFNFAFLGEFAPYFEFALFKRGTLTLSYEVFYLNQAALAANQVLTAITINTSPEVNKSAHFLAHGLYIGWRLLF